MKTYILSLLLPLVISLLITPLIIYLAHRWKVLDRPSRRKVHKKAMPRLGGVSIFLSFWIVVFAIYFIPNDIGGHLREASQELLFLFIGSLFIFILGIYDDVRGANAFIKFTAQIAVALFLFFTGFQIDLVTNPFGGSISLGWLSLPVTILWIVGIVNAFNLIDGLDGLAAGVSLIASLSIMAVAFILHHPLVILFMIILSGALLGFVWHNFNPAKIFLGDSGSLFLGYLLATTSISSAQKSATLVVILIPLLVLAFPIFDTSLAFFRRIKNRLSPFKGDRLHTHHLLLELGFSHRRSVITLYAFCLLLGLLAFLISFQQSEKVAFLLFLLGIAAVIIFKQGLDFFLLKKENYLLKKKRRKKAIKRLKQSRE